ncbi:MAG TPA: topoisomerase C-terminal repeat-containing protein, partial [Sphingomicrobium sp.]|nr:topoisomerase C-terminal repeat-containing protein [Sphingomicrobium sp.]
SGSREPIAVLGQHPSSGKEVKVMEGRFGPYASDGATHATLPKSADPKAVTLEEAVALIDAKAAKGPAARGSRGAKRRKS